jgi:mono/diheme cytochrome c family protein
MTHRLRIGRIARLRAGGVVDGLRSKRWSVFRVAAGAMVLTVNVMAAVDFKRDIQPIFSERCYSCHGAEKQKNNLRLDRRANALAGGDSGSSIVVSNSAESRLYKYVAGLGEKVVMPAKGERLTSNQVALIKEWIDTGAVWPESVSDVADNPANHWAFKAPRFDLSKRRPHDADLNRIDDFVAKEQKARQLIPAPEASRRTLIRRLSLDLLGLPPSPEEVEAFVADKAADAYEKLVGRLLASPHYGERWGRHWLDFARWAESESYEVNGFRSAAWRYRDYVVESFNRDKPYDQFLREQIAGDELEPYSDENIIATGFLSAARFNANEEDKAVQRNEPLVDMANATAAVTMGITMACAQCHDHKFDPITTRDYYRVQGFFVRGQMNSLLLRDTNLWRAYEAAGIPPAFETSSKLLKQITEPVRIKLAAEAKERLTSEQREALAISADQRTAEENEIAANAEKLLSASSDRIEKVLSEDDRKLVQELEKKIAQLDKEIEEAKPQTWGFYSPATSPYKIEIIPARGVYPLPYEPAELKKTVPAILRRGDVHRPADKLMPGLPEIISSNAPSHVFAGTNSFPTRRTLVDWLTSTNSPLTARVWVNLVWQHHFGRGLVATSGDFGLRGAKPSHPELLDWLANELIRSDWSTKHIHRLILLSNTYRQSTRPDANNAAIDPENKFLWRWQPRRLEAEAIRDSALVVSGELDRTRRGQSIKPEDEEKYLRRALYLRQKRLDPSSMGGLFDLPTANESCPKRHVSTVALQPLYMMNSEFMLNRSKAFAQRVRERAGEERESQITAAFEIAFARMPEESELRSARKLFGDSGGTDKLVQFCHALLNANEFVYLE